MAISTSDALPAGSITAYAGTAAPVGWLLCYGQAVSRATYAALFSAIGTAYGAGDGSTTFNIPDARGRALFGKDNMGGTAASRLTTAGGGVDGATLGAVGGGETITLTSAAMPNHGHQNAFAYNSAAGAGAGIANSSGAAGSFTPTQTSQNAGSNGAHRNIPPSLVINTIIKF